VVLTDAEGEPRLVLDADGYLRDLLVSRKAFDGYAYCHRPVVLRDPATKLDQVIAQMKRSEDEDTDQAIKHDIVLVWHSQRKVITGADILGRLLEGTLPPAAA
jgi:hypothetical protein